MGRRWSGPSSCCLGSHSTDSDLYELIEGEGVTVSFGVPTIWLGLVQYLEKTGKGLYSLKRLIIGGSACPPALMTTFKERHGVAVSHLWGMNETRPLGTVNHLLPKHASPTEPQRDGMRAKQGRGMFGVDLKIVNDAG